jgi:hypothetical protein
LRSHEVLLPGAACVAAFVDRFAESCHTPGIGADSWRQNEEVIDRSRGKASVRITRLHMAVYKLQSMRRAAA